jgi:hypothetical protein
MVEVRAQCIRRSPKFGREESSLEVVERSHCKLRRRKPVNVVRVSRRAIVRSTEGGKEAMLDMSNTLASGVKACRAPMSCHKWQQHPQYWQSTATKSICCQLTK